MDASIINPDGRDFNAYVEHMAAEKTRDLRERKENLTEHIKRTRQELLRKQLLLCQISERMGQPPDNIIISKPHSESKEDFGQQVYFPEKIEMLRGRLQKLSFEQIDLRIFEVVRIHVACLALEGVKFNAEEIKGLPDLLRLLE